MYYTGVNVDPWSSAGDIVLGWDLFTWTNMGDLTGATQVSTIFQAFGGFLYAGTHPDGDIFVSVDAGTTWTNTGDLAGATEARSIIQASDGSFYAGTAANGDIFMSVDSGATWTNTGNLAGAEAVYSVIQASDGTLLAGTYPNGEVFRSFDAGVTWVTTGDLVGATQVRSIIQASDGSFYAATNGGSTVYKSVDGGATWSSAGSLPAFAIGSSIIEAYDGALYVGTSCIDDTARVFRSVDAGSSWQVTDNLPGAQNAWSLIEPWDGCLCVGTHPAGDVFGSIDAGGTWVHMGDLAGATAVYSLMSTPTGFIYAGTAPDGEVFRAGGYFTVGDIASSVYETPNASVNYGVMTWTETLNGQAIQLQIRTDTLPDMSTAVDWSVCPPVVNGQDISSLSSVSDLQQYLQYRAVLWTASLHHTPLLHDVAVVYDVDLQGPILDSAVASDGTNPVPGVDNDDYVTIVFDEATNKPSIDAGNIDGILTLSGGHSWLDGFSAIGGVNWDPTGDRLAILLSDDGGTPTVAVGDTITPDGITITDQWGTPAVSPVVITGSFDPPGIQENTRISVSQVFALSQNEPNPFSRETVITYHLASDVHVKLEVYDLSGRLVETLVDGPQGSGSHESRWIPEDISAGIYFCRLSTGDSELIRKMVVVE
jgi:photosystem II stability/assembly factor-like uncharacterized protein